MKTLQRNLGKTFDHFLKTVFEGCAKLSKNSNEIKNIQWALFSNNVFGIFGKNCVGDIKSRNPPYLKVLSNFETLGIFSRAFVIH